ncbi:Heme chaperone HemW [Camellia lanceoleosa]|uniref:Heme chaperone HemW n=1 Tax=Camellia lanceoleosa TaxID=1840588 RepID=A0ACC0HVS0_9ERIC|nr:Heme chaperone HemW [Camellia lanceoleosa]
MLRSTFTPLLHTIPSKPKPPNLFSHSISISLSQSPPTVRQNASPTATTTTTNPLRNLSPTSAYIHLPFCRKRCHYCDFPIVALGSSSTQTNDINNDPRISNYIHLLCREIKATNSQFNHNPPLKTVFFGGGVDGVGVNRVSLGVQAFQDELLKACGRAHGVDEVHEAIGVVGICGVENWSMDLISSLPHQTPQMWEESLLLTINARPKHVSVYDLQVERGTKFGILENALRCPLLPLRNQQLLQGQFREQAQPNLLGQQTIPWFWPWFCQFLGSIQIFEAKKDESVRIYVQNLEDGVVGLSEDSFPDPKDMAMDAVMLSFRTAKGLDLKSFRKTFGTSIVHSLGKAYRPFVESGHVVCLDGHRRVITTDRFCALLSDEEEIEETVAFIRLSDLDGFLLSNELISLAFQVIAP